MSTVVPLAQAGRFFPANPDTLKTTLHQAWQAAGTVELPQGAEVIISPHAGYRFCVDVAARAYRSARACTQVLLLSPSHYQTFAGMAVPSHDGYQVGAQTVALDQKARHALAAHVHVNDAPHAQEHGIETQIPMLAHWLNAPLVLPVIIGRAKPAQIAALIADWRSYAPDGVVVLSSDLSHTLTRSKANTHDHQTASLIETAQGAKITGAHACGWQGIAGALALPQITALRPVRLGMTNSARVTGDETGTVGYGAWAFVPPEGNTLGLKTRQDALRVARQMVEGQLKNARPPHLQTKTFAAPLQGYGASFITWKKAGQLRGCIGSLAPHRPLIEDIATNAIKAALQDPRFSPVTQQELPDLELKIAILSNPAPMRFRDETDLRAQLHPHRDGLILSDGAHRGTFLPMVWESLPTPDAFLRALKRKAGLPEDHWSNTLRIQRYRAESFHE